MKKKLILISTFFGLFSITNAQVGISTTNPVTALDIIAKTSVQLK